jgi:hypothetical protein
VCHEKAEPPVRKDAPKQSLGAIGRVIELRSERRRASEIRCPITAFGHDNIRVQVGKLEKRSHFELRCSYAILHRENDISSNQRRPQWKIYKSNKRQATRI